MSKYESQHNADGAKEKTPVDQVTEITQVAGGLAHEIKNPLSTIRLNMELLAEDLAKDDSPRAGRSLKRIETVQRECQRLQELLDDFLNYTKVRSAKLAPTDLNSVIEETLEFYQPQANEAGVEVLTQLDSDLPSVLLDREVFHGALLNLILNAQEAMRDGGQLILRTKTAGHGVDLVIIDTGCGMDDRTAAQMFDAFYSTKPAGSGLGLPTTQRIIAAHGGTISVQSVVGQGTQFTVHLPAPARLE